MGRQEAEGEAEICKQFTGTKITEQFGGRRGGIKIKSSMFIHCAVKAIPVWDYYKWVWLRL